MSAATPEPMGNFDKAWALAKLNIHVFPVDRHTKFPPKGSNGFYDATTDIEQIATWFDGEYADRSKWAVAVWVGASGLLALDIDKKDGKNGFKAIKDAGLEVSETFHYQTTAGGEHRIWSTDNLDLGPQQAILGKDSGVDIRAGGSYIVWWGDTVPTTRDEFKTDIPDWVVKAATPSTDEFTGEGFSGTVSEWLESIPGDPDLPSSKTRDFMARIPADDFGHVEMVDLAWELVRMGSERESGIVTALKKLRSEWLRGKYDTPANRKDFDTAIRGGINKGGRVQLPTPTMVDLDVSGTVAMANRYGIGDLVKTIQSKVSETDTELDLSRMRKQIFQAARDAKMKPGEALRVVATSKAFLKSKATLDSIWFSDGESVFHDAVAELVAATPESMEESDEEAEKSILGNWYEDSQAYSFLTPGEDTVATSYKWWGKEYLDYVESQLSHFNRPYHVAGMWAALATIVSPFGKVPLPGAELTDCNLYVAPFGMSSSGKSEAMGFTNGMIDAYYGREEGPILSSLDKLSANGLHHALVKRNNEPSFVYGDEVQSFFGGVQTTQWQSGILGDISSYYGGEIPAKQMLNDKEISGERARGMLTIYLTGIATQMLEAINLGMWGNGLFLRFIWSFGEPRDDSDDKVHMRASSISTQKATFDAWAKEFKRQREFQKLRWSDGREVAWDKDALDRMEAFNAQMKAATKMTPFYDEVFVAANGRFRISVMKCATLIALAEGAETVNLTHLLVALSFAGPWHRSMVIAVSETAKEPFQREVDRVHRYIKKAATRGAVRYIQRSAIMRQFEHVRWEIINSYLQQLVEQGWLRRDGDTYQLTES